MLADANGFQGREMTLLRSIMALAFALIATAASAEPLTLRLDFLPTGYHAPIFLALEKGWFQKAGVDLTVIDGNGSATTVQLVGSGQVDIGHAALSVMAVAKAKGLPLTSVAAVFRKGDIALLLPAESPIKSVKDLAGKTIAYASSSFEAPFMDVFLATGGQTRDTVKLQNMDAGSKTATVIAGTVDGVMGSDVNQLPLINAKRPARALTFSEIGLNLPGYGLVVSPDTLKKKGDVIKKFASVLSGAWTYALAGHEQEAVDAIIKQRPEARLDPAIVLGQIGESRKHLFTPSTEKLPIGMQSEEDWKQALEVLVKSGAIPEAGKPTDYFTNDYFDQDLIAKTAKGNL